MAEITKHLGIAITDADAGRITHQQLIGLLQEAIDNGDILEQENEYHVVTTVLPLIDQGLLNRSVHVATFERRMNSLLTQRIEALTDRSSRANQSKENAEVQSSKSKLLWIGLLLLFGLGLFESVRTGEVGVNRIAFALAYPLVGGAAGLLVLGWTKKTRRYIPQFLIVAAVLLIFGSVYLSFA